MNNFIYLRRSNKLFLEKGNNDLPGDYLLNLLKNVEGFGYTFSPELLEIINTLSVERFKIFYNEVVANLKDLRGANFQYEPMYPNFPDQVRKMSDTELYTNAFIHYIGDWIGKRILPDYDKVKRVPLSDKVKLKVITLGNSEEFNLIFTRLAASKSSISESDKNDLEWFIKTYGESAKKLLPDVLPLKENVAVIIGAFIRNNIGAQELIDMHVKTATDVLRIASAISDGDVTLAVNTKFKTFSKNIRRTLLQALENCDNITEDMLRYKNRWKRLGEKLHPFEYKKRYPKCFDAFDIIRNDKPFETFNSKIERSIRDHDSIEAISLLKLRPGEFARRLDKLLRMSADSGSVASAFGEIAKKISTPVLLQVHCHFKSRNEHAELRTFFPKGEVSKVKAIENKLPPIDVKICDAIVSICSRALVARFSSYKPLGKIYLDEALKDFTVPFSQRSSSKALKTISRGSKLQLPEGDTLRLFIYWKDGSDRTDIDLSAIGLNADNSHNSTIAYYNLKEVGGYHSGDITSAPDGASEFLDIEISKYLARGIRFLLMSINSFTQQPFSELPVCLAGFMMRQHPDSGEIYEPLTVANKFDLTSKTHLAIPLIFDLEERRMIWTDLGLKSNTSKSNNVINNLSSISIINLAMTTLKKPSLYDLFSFHLEARGERTFDQAEANTIFDVDKGIKPTDIDIIVSEYL
jgi:hypothetical protein